MAWGGGGQNMEWIQRWADTLLAAKGSHVMGLNLSVILTDIVSGPRLGCTVICRCVTVSKLPISAPTVYYGMKLWAESGFALEALASSFFFNPRHMVFFCEGVIR